jgi:hypothetical protein
MKNKSKQTNQRNMDKKKQISDKDKKILNVHHGA